MKTEVNSFFFQAGEKGHIILDRPWEIKNGCRLNKEQENVGMWQTNPSFSLQEQLLFHTGQICPSGYYFSQKSHIFSRVKAINYFKFYSNELRRFVNFTNKGVKFVPEAQINCQSWKSKGFHVFYMWNESQQMCFLFLLIYYFCHMTLKYLTFS